MKSITPTPNSSKSIIIAIDPDLTASGVAAYSRNTKEWLFAKKITIDKILEELNIFPINEVIIYVECGWLNKKSNFRKNENRRISDNISMKVGQNHAIGKVIIALLEASGYLIVKFQPLKKGILKGPNGWTKVGRTYIELHSGLRKRINDDVRDAIFAVMNFY